MWQPNVVEQVKKLARATPRVTGKEEDDTIRHVYQEHRGDQET